jgi:2-polyprenyl-3-methyl-5-hydroxy-6-metoxy-1,4-benzoquinol methylase
MTFLIGVVVSFIALFWAPCWLFSELLAVSPELSHSEPWRNGRHTYLGLGPGLLKRLAGGISVADIGCGSGHVANLMGQAFPRSTFVGYDMSNTGIARAAAEADSMRLTNVRFDLLDLVELPEEPKFDLITAFDVIHARLDRQRCSHA